MKENKWHNLGVAETLSNLGTSPDGLSQEEAQKRLALYGPNELTEKKKISPWTIFLEQFKDILIIILLIAVALSAFLGITGMEEGGVADAIVIGIIVVFAASLGFIQEYRAEKSMEALKQMAAPTATVFRDGKEIEIPARELVPGDIIQIVTGDRIPADSRLIEAVNLKTEEAPLTGESLPVEKIDKPVEGDVGVGDRRNMVFLGTAAVYGRGKAVVTGTGMKTEFGKIATLLQDVKEEETPLQVNLDKMSKWIAIGALALCLILAALGVLRGHAILEMLIWGVSLAVAAVPEALPAVVTISLALGVQKMVKRHALVRKLPSVETLGSTTVICTDKTGTLTQNQMTIRRLYADGKYISVSGSGYEPKGNFTCEEIAIDPAQNRALNTLLCIGTLSCDTRLVQENGGWQVKGDPTEGALVVAAAKAQLHQHELNQTSPRIGEIPFSSETKRMTTVHKTAQGILAYSKGAPEVILSSSRYVLINGEERPISDKDKTAVLDAGRTMASEALRVLGLAYKKLPDNPTINDEIERDMVFVGLAGMIDPPRVEVKDAVQRCHDAGINVVMITGDHKLTAEAIARELGILHDGISMEGAELDKLSDAEFDKIVGKVEVYARVSPAHKLRVVEAFNRRGQVVAMTGDGVNDAPALKKADIGIAMGITGTDVSKEASDMVLTDDNFASIVAAVEEGRGIFENIKKYLMYLLSSNIGEILLMAFVILFGTLIGLPAGAIPLAAIQILFVNLVTDGLPALALSVDPPDKDIMKMKPRPKGQGVFTKPVIALMLTGGLWSMIVNVGIFWWALSSGKPLIEAQSITFLTLVMIQFFKSYNFRSDVKSIFKIGFFGNKWLNLSILVQLPILWAIFEIPFLEEVFGTFPLTPIEWVISILACSTVFIVLEVAKWIIRAQNKRKEQS